MCYCEESDTKSKGKTDKNFTHLFKVKAPLLNKSEIVCLLGSGDTMGDWTTEKPLLLSKEEDWWVTRLDLKENGFPVAYKYGVYDTSEKKFIRYEDGNNRFLFSDGGKKRSLLFTMGLFIFLMIPGKVREWQFLCLVSAAVIASE